jgi:cellulose synthase/poly-beta-1,6-N-acetylglucosamine synthase-like glycosyltransferase
LSNFSFFMIIITQRSTFPENNVIYAVRGEIFCNV